LTRPHGFYIPHDLCTAEKHLLYACLDALLYAEQK